MTRKPETNKSGCFGFLVDIFQIIGAVAGVMSVLIAVVALIYAARNPGRVEQIVEVLAGVTPSPTAVAPTLTATPTEPPIPTTKPTPTASLTATPADTPIPTATSTPETSDDTPAGTILEIGEPWTKEGLRITLVSISWGETALVIPMEVKNRSGNVILFEWSEENFVLVDNLGNRHANNCGSGRESLAAGETYQIPCGPTIWKPPLKWSGGWWFDQNVTDLTLVVTDLSRINEAKWHISVPH